MNIDELRSAQSKERQKSDLQQLRESFYGDVADYVAELEAERDRAAERAEDPFGSPEVQQLTNDIETAKDTAEAIYERRLGKIVKKASLVSAEMANPDDVTGLTAEEQRLFADLVERIEENKAHMLDVIAGDAEAGAPGVGASDDETGADAGASGDVTSAEPAPSPDAPHPEDGLDAASDATGAAGGADSQPSPSEAAAVAGDEDDDGVSAADLMSGGATSSSDTDAADATPGVAGEAATAGDAETDRPTTSADRAIDAERADGGDGDRADGGDGDRASDGGATRNGDDAERATLRVTQDVGEIFGVDEREYRLGAEDVVTLPEANADVLLQQGAAERLD